MDMNLIVVAGAAATFSSFIGCLIGFNIREKRYAEALEDTRSYWKARSDGHEEFRRKFFDDAQAFKLALEQETAQLEQAKGFIESLREQNRLLELGTDELHSELKQRRAVMAQLNEYRDAVRRMLNHNGLNETGTAIEQVERLCVHAACIALDPAVSKPAKNLITRGVRQAGIKWRKKLAKMEAARDRMEENWQEEFNEHNNTLGEKSDFRHAVRNTLNDKVGLVGVRRALKNAIGTEYDRLRAVRAQNEETK